MPIRTVQTLCSAILALAAVTAPAHAGEPLKIEGVGISRDIACDGEDVGVYGASNKIELTGPCGRVIVYGSDHEVTFERATEVLVSGSELKVRGGETGRLGVETDQNEVEAKIAGGGEAASVEISGVQHKVKLTFAKASTLQVNGVSHAVEWSTEGGAPKPKISSTGAANSIKQKK